VRSLLLTILVMAQKFLNYPKSWCSVIK
jgi:hypothetical protein